MREGLEWRRSRCGAEQGEVKQCKGFALKPRKARPERSDGHAHIFLHKFIKNLSFVYVCFKFLLYAWAKRAAC